MSKKGSILVHCLAYCQDCSEEFRDEDFWKVKRKAYYHAKKTGHRITVETGYSNTYFFPKINL